MAVNGCLETSDVCEILGVQKWTVYQLVKDGELTAADNLYHQRKRFYVEDLMDFLHRNQKYSKKVLGIELPEVKVEEPKVMEPDPEPEKTTDIASELWNKLEVIEKMINEHKAELAKLEAQRSALEEVIDMF